MNAQIDIPLHEMAINGGKVCYRVNTPPEITGQYCLEYISQ